VSNNVINTKSQPVLREINGKFLSVWFGWAFGFLLLAVILGLIMRYFFIGSIPGLVFSNIKHAHSHVAMLGWSFLLSGGLLLALFIKHTANLKIYRIAFALTILSVLGMAVSFPIQGYGLYSISFSTLQIVASYLFAFAFFKDMKYNPSKSTSRQFAVWGVFWLLFSTIGLWAIAPIDIHLGRLHPLYYMSIQWYLHFQLIGWFTYAILAALFRYLELKGYNTELSGFAFWMFQISLMLTYALSVSWSSPASYLFYVNTIGVVLQLIAGWYIVRPIYKAYIAGAFHEKSWSTFMILAGISTFVLRIVIQTGVVIPAVAVISYTIRWYVLAFIHLIMLGTFTLIAAGLMGNAFNIGTNRLSVIGWMIFFAGFISTELLMFLQGTMLWMQLGFMPSFHHFMFWTSALFPLGILLVFADYLLKTGPNNFSYFLINKSKEL